MKKIKGRYQNKDRRVIDREYMSYEDVPIEDYRDEEPIPKNLTKKFLKVFLILFISVVVVLALTNINSLTPDNISHWFQYDLLGKTEGDGYPIKYNGTNVKAQNFELMESCPVYCSDTTFAVLNSNAGLYQEAQHSFANPSMNVNAGYSLIYNINATGYKIINREKIIRSSSAKGKIFCADISKNGVYALLTEGKDYLSQLIVYRNDNLEKYRYNFADYYVNRVALNSDGSRAVLSGVSAKNGGLVSVIYILDFSQENYLQKYEVEDRIIYDVKYLNSGNVIAVGESSAYYINVNDNKKTDIPYNSRVLTNYALDREDGLLLSLSQNPDGKECDVIMINNRGEQIASISTGKSIQSMDYRNNRIAILFTDSLCLYSMNGDVLSTVQSEIGTKKICFYSDSTLYTLGKSQISQVKMNLK